MKYRWHLVIGFWITYQVQCACTYENIKALERRVQTLEVVHVQDHQMLLQHL